MPHAWTFAHWLSRVILVAGVLILTLVSVKFITDPVQSARASGVVVESAEGITTLRVGIGAFPLGCALVGFFCVLAKRRVLSGLSFVATIIGVALVVRAAAAVFDHTIPASLFLLRAEGILLALMGVGIVIEVGRRRLEGIG
jgi:hypothetical protein